MNESEQLAEKLKGSFGFLSRKTDLKKKKTLRISELTGCARKPVYLRKLKIDIPINARMFNGSMFHEFIPKLVKDIPEFEGAKFEFPVKYLCTDGFVIEGHADAATEDMIYEFKYSGYKNIIPAYIYQQANAYAIASGRGKYRIVMVSPYNLAVSVFEGDADADAFEMLVDKAREVFNVTNGDGVMPFGPSWEGECLYCPYVETCLKENGDLPSEVVAKIEKQKEKVKK